MSLLTKPRREITAENGEKKTRTLLFARYRRAKEHFVCNGNPPFATPKIGFLPFAAIFFGDIRVVTMLKPLAPRKKQLTICYEWILEEDHIGTNCESLKRVVNQTKLNTYDVHA